jgi:hypothetical protein
VGSCRRELLDHIIALKERHLRRLLSEFVSYYHDDRTHLGLFKETPGRRICSAATGQVIAYPRLGGLHHRYERRGLISANSPWLTPYEARSEHSHRRVHTDASRSYSKRSRSRRG